MNHNNKKKNKAMNFEKIYNDRDDFKEKVCLNIFEFTNLQEYILTNHSILIG